MGFQNDAGRCSTCGGSGSVVVKENKKDAATGRTKVTEAKHACPTCKGSGCSSGLMKK